MCRDVNERVRVSHKIYKYLRYKCYNIIRVYVIGGLFYKDAMQLRTEEVLSVRRLDFSGVR